MLRALYAPLTDDDEGTRQEWECGERYEVRIAFGVDQMEGEAYGGRQACEHAGDDGREDRPTDQPREGVTAHGVRLEWFVRPSRLTGGFGASGT
jgi:hypothetical protein